MDFPGEIIMTDLIQSLKDKNRFLFYFHPYIHIYVWQFKEIEINWYLRWYNSCMFWPL